MPWNWWIYYHGLSNEQEHLYKQTKWEKYDIGKHTIQAVGI
jgi:hypothetical protein